MAASPAEGSPTAAALRMLVGDARRIQQRSTVAAIFAAHRRKESCTSATASRLAQRRASCVASRIPAEVPCLLLE
ncbi:hypothetical protein C2845_PM13G12200 [Panicum miliaceum]|uniref:Uncharacterized protein n=1 Tax=Panicum miliaceum TaxID=4540 RepID=A0A3L6RIU6_PANMI|nr:hypothetical protein C2845_PM13G12200 [Panicum miliaceum]